MTGGKSNDETVDGDAEITLGLLNAVQESSAVTQRGMASDLGIALGLANAYLKRCVHKGYIKVSQIPPNRYAYYLTPHGFSEKSRLTAEYLSSSFDFFRSARSQCETDLQRCVAQGWTHVALAGVSELAEIATLCATESPIVLTGLIDPHADKASHAGLAIVTEPQNLSQFDAILITDLANPQSTFDRLVETVPIERLMAPPMLGVDRARDAADRENDA
jgi:hypothetical protein